jgi:putative transposase
MARLLIDTFAHYRREQKFLIHEFVVMPDHFHLLLTPLNIPLAKVVQFIKGGFSHRVRKELGLGCEVWERGYVDHRIRNANDYECHVEYIRQNPVRAGILGVPEVYPYSSAHPGCDVDPCFQELKPNSFLIA